MPYETQSPITGKVKRYDEEELEKEFELIAKEPSKFTVGQNLYYQLVLISDMNRWMEDWCQEAIEDYMLTTRFNVPLAEKIDDLPWERVNNLFIIDNEYLSWQKR